MVCIHSNLKKLKKTVLRKKKLYLAFKEIFTAVKKYCLLKKEL